MDQSNNRVAAEDALNDVKAKLENLKASGADAAPLRQELEATIAKYGAEFPEVGVVLQPIADELRKRSEANRPKNISEQQPPTHSSVGGRTNNNATPKPTQPKGEKVEKLPDEMPPLNAQLAQVKIDGEDVKRWSEAISDKIDTLGKQDSLGMIHLQDFSAQINRAKDTASALMASADKAADNIVAHIA